MANTLEQELSKYFMQLNDAEKKSVIKMLKTFLKSRKANPNRIAIEKYNQEIDSAVARVEEGEFLSQEDVENLSKDW